MQNYALGSFCDFALEYSLTSQVIFLRLSPSFLSDPNCSHSEVKIAAKIKATVA